MFRPDSTHLFVGREFAAVRPREGLVKRRLFFRTQLKQRLIFTGQLQEHASEFVLYFRGKATHRLDGLFKQFGHAWTIELLPAARKDFEGNREADHSVFKASKTTKALARNGRPSNLISNDYSIGNQCFSARLHGAVTPEAKGPPP
jgi:hypothetical protein